MSREQRLSASFAASTEDSSLDLQKLFADDIGSAASSGFPRPYGVEGVDVGSSERLAMRLPSVQDQKEMHQRAAQEAAAKAAALRARMEAEAQLRSTFSGDLVPSSNVASANLQQPVDASPILSAPPSAVSTANSNFVGGDGDIVMGDRTGVPPLGALERTVPSVSSQINRSAPGSVFGGPSLTPFVDVGVGSRDLTGASAAARQRGGTEEVHSGVVGEGVQDAEGMAVEEEKAEEAPNDPEVDTDSPRRRNLRKQARWYYTTMTPSDDSECYLFKEFSRLSICCEQSKTFCSSATQVAIGVESLEQKNAHRKRRRESAKESRRVAIAARKAATSTSAPAAAAASSAANSTPAAGAHVARPSVVHPPSVQQKDSRDATPVSKRRKKGKKQDLRGHLADIGAAKQQKQAHQQGGNAPGRSVKKPQGPGEDAANSKPTATKAKKKQQPVQAPTAVTPASQNKVDDRHPPATASGSGLPRQEARGAADKKQEKATSSSTLSSSPLDPSDGQHIAEDVLQEAARTSSKTPYKRIIAIANKLPKDFYPSLRPHMRVESAAQVFDMRERSRIDEERAAARRQVCVVDQQKVKSDERIAALRREIEEEGQRNAAKAKELDEAKARVKSSVNRVFKSSIVDSEALLVPPPTAAASPSVSSTSTSRPNDDPNAPKNARAPKKPYFRSNRGRR